MAGLIVFDPDNEEVGLSTGDDVAVNSYLDIQSDTLYFTDGSSIYEWEGEETGLRQVYTWKSGEIRLPSPVNLGAALIEAEAYTETIGAVAGDDDFTDVILLAKWEGADAATAYTEIARSEPGIFSAQAQLDTAEFNYGASSLLLDGTDDTVEFGSASDDWTAYQLASTDDVFVEGFVRFAALPTTGNIFGLVTARGQDFINFDTYLENSAGTYRLGARFGFGNSPTANLTTPTLNTWYYFAIQRRYNAGSPQIDFYWGLATGPTVSRVATVASSNNPSAGTEEPIRIGSRVTSGSTVADFFNGHFDDVRVTKAARAGDVASYAVPTDYQEQQSVAGTSYDITFRLYADDVLKHTQVVTDDEPFRLPGGYLSNIYSVEVESAMPVTRISVAENIFELSEG